MLNMSRRDFVVSTGLAAALGLNARLVISPAFAQKTPDPAKPFVRYKIGDAEVTAVYDGIWEKAHDPAFIKNVSVAETKQALVAAKLPADLLGVKPTGKRSVAVEWSPAGGPRQATTPFEVAGVELAGAEALAWAVRELPGSALASCT